GPPFMLQQLRPRNAVEMQDGTGDLKGIAYDVDKQSLREEFAQRINMQRILWCPIHPAHLWFGWQPRGFAFSFEIGVVSEDQFVDALAKCDEEFIGRYIHSAQDRAIATSSANPVSDGNI